MEAILSKLLEELNSSVFILFLILGVVILCVYKLGKWTEVFKHHDAKISKSEENYDKFGALVTELKIKMDLVYQNTNPNRMVQAHSPISLTPSGLDTAGKINATQLLEQHMSELNAQVTQQNPQNAYDIQMVCMDIAKNKMIYLLNEQDLNAIKQAAFDRGVLVEDIMSIFGVLLRNHVLEARGIPIADVDKHQKP